MNTIWDNQVLVIKNFVTPEICNKLAQWAENNRHSQFKSGIHRDSPTGEMKPATNRVTTRFTRQEELNYPAEIYQIQNEIEKLLQLDMFPKHQGQGSNGIVVSITDPGGDVYAHYDGVKGGDTIILRCNVLAKQPNSGGNVVVENKEYQPEQGDLMCYEVSELLHSVQQVGPGNSRIMFMIGWMLPKSYFKTKVVPHVHQP